MQFECEIEPICSNIPTAISQMGEKWSTRDLRYVKAAPGESEYLKDPSAKYFLVFRVQMHRLIRSPNKIRQLRR